jgi:hypothetical protein
MMHFVLAHLSAGTLHKYNIQVPLKTADKKLNKHCLYDAVPTNINNRSLVIILHNNGLHHSASFYMV